MCQTNTNTGRALSLLGKGGALHRPIDSAASQRLDVHANKYAPKSYKGQCVAIVMDATGSMGWYWQELLAKATDMATQLIALLPDIQVALIAYRDYCSGEQVVSVLEPTADLALLSQWLRRLQCSGGGSNDGEAVEQGLLSLLKLPQVNMAVLIGDEPPTKPGHWSLRERLDYRQCATQLKEQAVPVYTMAVPYDGPKPDHRTVKAFTEIAETTGGKNFPIDDMQLVIDLIVGAAATKNGKKDDFSLMLAKKDGGTLSPKSRKILALLPGS